MHSLADVMATVHNINANHSRAADTAGSPTSIIVPGVKKIPLPHTEEGLRSREWALCGEEILGEYAELSNSALFNAPTLAIPLAPRQDAKNLRRAVVALHITLPEGDHFYGLSLLEIDPAGLGWGMAKLEWFRPNWYRSHQELGEALVPFVLEISDQASIRAENGSIGWNDCVFFLKNKTPSIDGPISKRQLSALAGLFGINMTLHTLADENHIKIKQAIIKNPPAALMMMADQLKYSAFFESEYLVNKPSGIVEMVDSPMGNSLKDSLLSIALHLQNVKELIEDKKPRTTGLDDPHSWAEAIPMFTALVTDYFQLSDNALACLHSNNAYQHPARMLHHFKALQRLALAYSSNQGNLGGNITEIAHSQFSIEIALSDKSLDPPVVKINNAIIKDAKAVPHVKVDDVKSKNECGRIYFAIQQSQMRFIVDHIGIHDYA